LHRVALTAAVLMNLPEVRRCGQTYRSQSTLADECGVSLSVFKEHLRELQRHGERFIISTRKHGRTDLLTLNCESWENRKMGCKGGGSIVVPRFALHLGWNWATISVYGWMVKRCQLFADPEHGTEHRYCGDSIDDIATALALDHRSVKAAIERLDDDEFIGADFARGFGWRYMLLDPPVGIIKGDEWLLNSDEHLNAVCDDLERHRWLIDHNSKLQKVKAEKAG